MILPEGLGGGWGEKGLVLSNSPADTTYRDAQNPCIFEYVLWKISQNKKNL